MRLGTIFAAALLAVAAAVPAALAVDYPADCKVLYPPYVAHESEMQYVVDPDDQAWEAYMYSSRHANGADSLDFGKFIIESGRGFPVHRHPHADEWLVVVSGEGSYWYWGFDLPEPVQASIGPGSVMFNQQGQLHKVFNNGTEPLVLMSVSKAASPTEFLAGWPETPDGGLGHTPPAAPWEAFCAPGHEQEEVAGEEEGSHVEFEAAGEDGEL
ncbi:hypothetical protein HYH03_005588 [Edaphochlamys debaryana]|uniref:Cupin type-2 domain-containing protein n=1 Tax=Edaphochlamys debaryana TaxID=47281 RepID=A0A835Y7U4_9CHLO|nr:hypothetical protein HYH03_005588 [Edaphochlamys debaryana]|eukprot:KAG2496358.1 hypothetical protein HYH03_005588 [Edaphochlamys debaryana]